MLRELTRQDTSRAETGRMRPALARQQSVRILGHSRQTMLHARWQPADSVCFASTERCILRPGEPILDGEQAHFFGTECRLQVREHLIGAMIAAIAVGLSR